MNVKRALPLAGKAIAITGAARGLGAAYARSAAALGANLIIADIDEKELKDYAAALAREGAVVEPIVLDVSCKADLESLVEFAVQSYGTLDGMVNNAVLSESMAELGAFDDPTVRQMFAVNVFGTIFGTEAAAAVMKRQGSGSIVNVTSGAQSGMRRQSIYGATKGAISSYTYSAALDLAPHGIRVNAISPMGLTRMVEINQRYRANHDLAAPTVTLPPPENNAAAVVFLLSDASGGVTGQVLRVDPEGLSMVSHPNRLEESLVRGTGWTFERVAEAYQNHLRHYLTEVGNLAAVT